MSETDDRVLTALRERLGEISRDLAATTARVERLTAAADELAAAIEIVERHGRKRPGPKPGTVRLADPIEMPTRVSGSAASPDPEEAA